MRRLLLLIAPLLFLWQPAAHAQKVSSVPTICGSAASSCPLKAAPGNIVQLYVTPSAAGYLMIFNSATVPVNGSTTAGVASGNMTDCIAVAAGSTVSMQVVPMWQYSAGIYVAYSSTGCTTLTLSATAFIKGVAQ